MAHWIDKSRGTRLDREEQPGQLVGARFERANYTGQWSWMSCYGPFEFCPLVLSRTVCCYHCELGEGELGGEIEQQPRDSRRHWSLLSCRLTHLLINLQTHSLINLLTHLQIDLLINLQINLQTHLEIHFKTALVRDRAATMSTSRWLANALAEGQTMTLV